MLVAPLPDDLCLGFANTLFWRGSEPQTETLRAFPDLLDWIDKSVGTGGTQALRAWAREHEKKAERVFGEAIAVREALYRTFSAVAAGKPVRDADFAALKTALAEAPERRQLARADGRYGWRLDGLRPEAPDLLAPVLWSAGDLIVNAERRRIRECANEKCLWLFMDASKSGTRRWCDMAACGNRAKAQRHYARMKDA
jgi:predicted RNA-binding Zn ribbon-like protein